MDELVQRLADGSHRVELVLRPERTPKAMKDCIDHGHVHIRFMDTRGGTELGLQLDSTRSDFGALDLEHGVGQARFVGTVTLNYVPIRCIADIDLPSYEGQGRVEVLV